MVSLRPEEISKLIKEQIRRYDDELETGETGTVITIGDGIALFMAWQMQWLESCCYFQVMSMEWY